MAFWFPILFYLGRVRWETAPKKLGDEEKKAVLCLQNGNRSVLRWALPFPETGIAVPAAGFRPCLLSTGPPHQGNAKTRVDERSTPELDFLTRRAGQSDASALWSSEREPGAPPPTRRLRWLGLSQGLEFWSTAQQPRQGSILPGAPHRLGLALFEGKQVTGNIAGHAGCWCLAWFYVCEFSVLASGMHLPRYAPQLCGSKYEG